MPIINPSLPTTGQPNSSEEPKIVTALSQLVGAVNNVDGTQLLDGAVTASKLAAQPVWTSLAMSGLGSLSYYKDGFGCVAIEAASIVVGGANIPANTVLATLPAGFRPRQPVVFPLYHLNTDTVTTWTISGNGNVSSFSGLSTGHTYNFMGGLWRAEQ